MKAYVRAFLYANLGDDLFIRLFTNRYPDVEITVVVNKEYADVYSQNNISVIGLSKIQRGIHKVLCKYFKLETIQSKLEKKADICIVIGGSMFQELAGDIRAIERLQSFPGKYSRPYVLGVNFGPYYSNEYLNAVKKLLKNVEDVCFRDSYSYEFFKKNEKARWTRDIVFSICSLIPNVKIPTNNLVISVMDFSQKSSLAPYENKYIQFIINSARHFIKSGNQIKLVSFCKFEGDENAAQKIYKSFSEQEQKNIEICKYDGTNWIEIVELVRDAKYIIASRFHSMVLGFTYEVPTLPVLYSEKCIHVIEDLNLHGRGVKLEQLGDFIPNVNEFIKVENIEEVKRQSIKQFDALDDVLNSKR